MATSRKPMTNKLIIVGIDGMDPRFTTRMLNKGHMPNTKKVLERGVSAKDMVLLGGQPTITPPMWTTLATGANPSTHGITCYRRQVDPTIDTLDYNFDSRLCKAEQLWNVTAEAGLKTLVFHWPGSSWPPSSDSPNLMVVDGTQPGNVSMGVATIDAEKVLIADVKTKNVGYREKAAQDSRIPCVIDDLEKDESLANSSRIAESAMSKGARSRVLLTEKDGEGMLSDTPFDIIFSPVADAKNWDFKIPKDAKEFTLLHSGGLVRRPCLIVKNDKGIYDRVRIYKNKKDADSLVAELENDVFTPCVIDEAVKGDQKFSNVSRNMRILELAEDGTHVRIWISRGLDIDNDTVWHPKSLHDEVIENVGPIPSVGVPGGSDKRLMRDCMTVGWDFLGEWESNAIHYLIEKHDLDVVFSHFHCVDLQSHMIAKYLKTGHNDLTPDDYMELYENVYDQTDRYIGRYLDLIDKGWTVIFLSDHGLVCPEHDPALICDPSGVNAGVMGELGFTVLKKDADGNDTYEIDWEKTRAVEVRCNHIYLNIKGRNPHGIVDPADQWEVEEEIITALYGYRDKKTGKRVIEMALRAKDALLLGMGGEQCGDIIVWKADGYNFDHGDSLSTCFGYGDTSTSPIFFGAGTGLKEDFTTDRVIREVDVAPTVAALLGVRMPAQCEGAPAYQIFTEEF